MRALQHVSGGRPSHLQAPIGAKSPHASELFPRAYSRPCREIIILTSQAAGASQPAEQRHGVWHDDDPCNYFIWALHQEQPGMVLSCPTSLLHDSGPKAVTTFNHPSVFQESWGSRPPWGGRGHWAKARIRGRTCAVHLSLHRVEYQETIPYNHPASHWSVRSSMSPPWLGCQHNNRHQHGWSLVTIADLPAGQPDRHVSI